MIRLSCLSGLVLSCALTATAQPVKLIVRSSVVDLEAHRAAIELFNSGDKTVAAYTLDIRELQNGKELPDSERIIGLDNLYYSATPNANDLREQNLIKPGQTDTYYADTRPETTDLQVSILSVVYMDRTHEGDTESVRRIFQVRLKHSKEKQRSKAEISFWARQSGGVQ